MHSQLFPSFQTMPEKDHFSLATLPECKLGCKRRCLPGKVEKPSRTCQQCQLISTDGKPITSILELRLKGTKCKKQWGVQFKGGAIVLLSSLSAPHLISYKNQVRGWWTWLGENNFMGQIKTLAGSNLAPKP